MLSVLGIALAIACVTVVRTISSSFAITGAESVTDVLGDAQLWAVPAAGVHYDNDARALVADGPAPLITLPDGWRATRTYSGVTRVGDTPCRYGETMKHPRSKRFWVIRWRSGWASRPAT